eukprot:jgi/Tetstr1/428387/TSEL_018421.t1
MLGSARPSIGAALVDLLGVKPDYELPIAKICEHIVRGYAAAKNRHAQQDTVGRTVSAKVVEEAFCEEDVNVEDHNAALFKRWASYVKHSHAKDTAVCDNDLDDGDGGAAEQP